MVVFKIFSLKIRSYLVFLLLLIFLLHFIPIVYFIPIVHSIPIMHFIPIVHFILMEIRRNRKRRLGKVLLKVVIRVGNIEMLFSSILCAQDKNLFVNIFSLKAYFARMFGNVIN